MWAFSKRFKQSHVNKTSQMKPESGWSEVIGWIICLSRGTTSPHWFHPTTIRSLITTRCAYRIRSQSAEKTKAATNIHNFIKMGTQESSFPPPKKKSWESQHGKLRLPQNTLGMDGCSSWPTEIFSMSKLLDTVLIFSVSLMHSHTMSCDCASSRQKNINTICARSQN